MALTYTTAIRRDHARAADAARRLDVGDVLLAATSAVALLAIALAYNGRRTTSELAELARTGSTATVGLNEVTNATQLDPALHLAFTNASDRTVAGEHLLAFLRTNGHKVGSVGTILGARVTAAAIDRTADLRVYRERLQLARERAIHRRGAPPADIQLLTTADVASLKPALVVRTHDEFATTLAACAALYVVAFGALAIFWRLQAIRGDRFLLGIAHLLTAIGFAVLVSRSDPLRDSLLFVRYTQGITVGCLAVAAVTFLNARKLLPRDFSFLPLVGALGLSVLVILFGDGPGQSSAKVNLGPVQPIEAIRLLLALFLAGYFARRWELVRGLRTQSLRHVQVPSWLNVPRLEYVFPVIAGVTTASALFFIQRDLGPALLLACSFFAMYALARGRGVLAAAGVAGLMASFSVGYRLNISDTLNERVQMWLSPWDNAVRGGDQVAQAAWALATGGPLGVGLGLGDTRYLPAGYTDLVLAAVGEELGAIGLFAVAALYVLLAWRGLQIARRASTDYDFFLATSLTLFLVIPALVMGAGVLGMMPLTGVVTPFLSYGGSAMTVNLAALGMLGLIHAGDRASPHLEPFRVPVRWLAGALSFSTALLVTAFANVTVLRADEYAVRAHLSLQGDGIRRYQYNPRLLDAVRRIPRGTVYDRRGLPLASGNADVLRRARDAYATVGVALDATCREQYERCYPLGGKAFHLLGDSRSRINWSASNTSYVERDAEHSLRGFNDHATIVHSTEASGSSSMVRRDYRELLPLLRHRYNDDHADVRAFLSQPRDLRVTIDARLQARVAEILANAARRSATGRAAAVVIEPNTGEVLALASYPWPSASALSGDNGESLDETLLDRARYGLYPPGSTFKLLTATAALRQDPSMSRAVFPCKRLPDGRVGIKLPGRTRPIRDDVLDTHPHGAIGMHDAMVRSCNAYFAQLATRVGPDALLDVAVPLGITLAPANSRPRLRDTLPQAGYGQGDVLTTPMRMARVAAAFAADGVVPDAHIVRGNARKPEPLVTPQAARLIARYLRDAVLEGTGRSLRNHPWPIAGKTGTAELAGASSHAWFVGFAPYGHAAKRIAVAVVIENAGYGGLAAAPVAGEIVTAAAAAGLVE